MRIRTELHIHSCASPCGSLEMSPARIAREAAEKGIGLIALTDHNTARNSPAFEKCCRGEGITGLFGLEVTSREEAHILTIFAHVDEALEMGRRVEESLPDIGTRESPFGDQVYVDENEYILGDIPKALFSATEYSTEEILELAHSIGGIVIPSHIDRPSFSIVMQLGFLPDLPFDAVECVSRDCGGAETRGIPVIQNSDAHFPGDIGTRPSVYDLERADFSSLKRALEQQRRR